jgi:hypothetical protein
MNLIIFKVLILGIVILLIGLYLHIIINSKTNTKTNTKTKTNTNERFGNGTDTIEPISIQLTNQIAIKLGISIRRIQNLSYSGDLSTQSLTTSFTILDPNIIENANGEPNAQTAASNANSLFDRNNFIVKINNVNIRLNKSGTKTSTSTTNTDLSSYFNNTGLLEISDYAMQKYNQVPNDSSLTRFYNLTLDKNYNVKPILE